VTNLSAELREKLRAGPCRVYSVDMRVSISSAGRYVYPDLAVVCAKPLFRDDTLDTLLNPALICEVLSLSTRDYDRGDKFASYRTISSVQEYLTIDSDEVHIEQHVRMESGAWLLTDHRNLSDVIQLRVGTSLRVANIYEKVDFLHRPSA
jgi:Uma2 family endonuclease